MYREIRGKGGGEGGGQLVYIFIHYFKYNVSCSFTLFQNKSYLDFLDLYSGSGRIDVKIIFLVRLFFFSLRRRRRREKRRGSVIYDRYYNSTSSAHDWLLITDFRGGRSFKLFFFYSSGKERCAFAQIYSYVKFLPFRWLPPAEHTPSLPNSLARSIRITVMQKKTLKNASFHSPMLIIDAVNPHKKGLPVNAMERREEVKR